MITRLAIALYSTGARVAAASTSWWMRRKRRWSTVSIAQRYGRDLPPPCADRPIWIHAASMGEVRVGSALAGAIAARGTSILGSAMTETGYDLLQSTYPKGAIAIHAPFDLRSPVRSVLDRYKPIALILVETELWPNLLTAAATDGVPVFIVNGRLSDQSFPKYRRTRWFWRRVLSGVSRFYMRSQVDGVRLVALGVDPARVEVSGSLKSTDAPDVSHNTRGILDRLEPPDRPVWIAGSTRPGEEEIILASFAELQTEFPELQLWIAPRHPERFAAVTELIRKAGFSLCLWSELRTQTGRNESDVLLIDQMGILRELYGNARVAFVGGSLKPFGGHNPMEPVSLGIRVIFGPHMDTQRDAAEMLVRGHFAAIVNSQDDIVREVARVLHEPDATDAKVRRAAAIRSQASGVVEHIAADILKRIRSAQPS